MTNVWENAVFDRTLDDVKYAVRKIAEWKTYHSHHTGITVENDEFILQGNGTTYVSDGELVFQHDGAVYLENGEVRLDIDDVYDLKGCLNVSDLNRIEGNIAYLAERMENYFFHPTTYSKRWTREGLPTEAELSRILDNIHSLIDSFYTPNNSPNLPTQIVSYDGLNNVEETLHLLKELLDCLEGSLKKSGTIKSGSTLFLPMRR